MSGARLAYAAIGVILTFSPRVTAGDTTAATPSNRTTCITAADDGQRLRDEDKLTAAREQFITCASKSCPGVIAKQCSAWFEEVERDLPSVAFRARDEHGRELLDVRVLVDGAKIFDPIQPRPLTLDPLEHHVRFEREDGTSIEAKVLLRRGEKNKIVELSFPPASPVPVAQERPLVSPSPAVRHRGGFRIPLLGWTGAGVAVAGAGTAVAFALMANGDENALRSSCAPHCASSERDGIETKLAVANVGLVAGLVGLGVAVAATLIANTRAGERILRSPLGSTTAEGFGGVF